MAGERDALGLTPWQRAEAQQVAPGDVEVVTIAADPESAEIIEQGRYCPARIPCLGLTGVGIVVPVRRNGQEQVGEIRATYCPKCRAMKADQRES
jgi:hypothetical protein